MTVEVSFADKSWLQIDSNSDFSLQNLPFGVFKTANHSPRVGVAIGDQIVDLLALQQLAYLGELGFSENDFNQCVLNTMMKHGKRACADLRLRIYSLMKEDNAELRDNSDHRNKVLVKQSDATMLLPIQIGDYTDFYSSRDHATNVGIMFRDPANALLPNWLHIPVGYHGRASSIICSGEPIRRPKGQTKPNEDEPPVFGPSKLLDIELEMAFVTFDGKPLGESISTSEADDYIFGMTLFNDWSARDIQKWEYVPLGPFLAKNFASSMSPWIVTLEALEYFRLEGPKQEPEVLDYLKYTGNKHIDINLQVDLIPEGGSENTICRSNYKHMYWNMNQQLAHHTVNGCNIRCGDVMASGTISGPEPESFGSMLELSWKGTKPIPLNDGTERKFLQDGDTIVMTGYCEKDGIRIGFGEVRTKILPAL